MIRLKKVVAVILVCANGFLVGCGTKTIYVKDGDLMQLRQNIKNVKVWVFDKKNKRIASTIELQNGWYIGSMPEK